jgi:hypothetical protein
MAVRLRVTRFPQSAAEPVDAELLGPREAQRLQPEGAAQVAPELKTSA